MLFALVLLLGGLLLVLVPNFISAAPSALLAAGPQIASEGSKVTVTITLTGYGASQRFLFSVNVTDPGGSNGTALNKILQLGSNGNGQLTLLYPTNFTATPTPSTNLTGTYKVLVTTPNSTVTSPLTTTFAVGPAIPSVNDQLIYQRTWTLNITAAGYTPGSSATVNITQGGLKVSGFPHSVTVKPTGLVVDSWKIPANATLGNYLLQVFGTPTKKTADSQTVKVVRAVLSINGLSTASATGGVQTSFVRGNTSFAVFGVSYPNGTFLKTGTFQVNLTTPSPGSVLAKTLSASYDSGKSEFFSATGYTFPVNASTGTWTVRIDANTTVDSYGNAGPLKNVVPTFAVGPLTLKTSITSLKTTYNRTVTFNLTATVSYPTSDTFGSSSGPVFANLTSGTRMIKQNLTYNAGVLKWTGSITIPPDYPLGSATLQVSAHDKFGNTGTDTTFHITITPTTIIVHQIPFAVNGTSFQPFQTIGVQINATYINNKTLIPGSSGLGKITFNLPGGRVISIGLTLQSNGTLTGQYMIRETDPLGPWNLTIARWQLNDGNGNTNNKSVLGPVISILPIQLKFDSQYFRAPGNITITGDKATVGVAFRYPNGTFAQNAIVNGTILVNGQNMTYTFTYDTGKSKFLTTIDTTGWAPGRYQVNIFAYSADYRGYHVIQLTVQPTPFLIGPVVGVILILVILGIGVVEYRRRAAPKVE